MAMHDIVNIQFTKKHLSDLLKRVEAGQTVVIARNKKPIAKLIAVPVVGKRKFGALRGVVKVGDEFFEPLPEDELAAWGE